MSTTKAAQLEAAIKKISAKYESKLSNNEKLRKVFKNCFANTAETTVKFLDNDEVFIITGDIPAMWLRDSSAQVVHYLKFMPEYPILKDLVKGLIKRQIRYILIDPYANAFNLKEDPSLLNNDQTNFKSAYVWERKYEIDSLAYPIWLINNYYEITKDESIFTKDMHQAFKTIVSLWTKEQRHLENSDYYFIREDRLPSDTLINEGKGSKVKYTGMTWSGFRPSDDACKYHYLVPANIFAYVVLEYLADFAKTFFKDDNLAKKATKLRNEIKQGIEDYAIIDTKDYGKIYAYEVDGLGNYNLMDDANVPSLLSIPWLGYKDLDDEIYQNTRSFILSENNPYFYQGKYAKGIGSPHTPEGYIWHIALIMQALTAKTREEKLELVETILNTDGDKLFMHEGFNPDNPQEFTREWFAWANSLFALLIESLLD